MYYAATSKLGIVQRFGLGFPRRAGSQGREGRKPRPARSYVKHIDTKFCSLIIVPDVPEREALRWIQKYIGQFGGDPSKVTM